MIRITTYSMLTVSFLTVSIFVSAQYAPTIPLPGPRVWTPPSTHSLRQRPLLPTAAEPFTFISPMPQARLLSRPLAPGIHSMNPDHMICMVPDMTRVESMPVYNMPHSVDHMPNGIVPQGVETPPGATNP